ncbi:MAG: hypothetical protein SFU86_14015, partial [Pirellulaceae bacterium]|nr:hypothetical protein [Pirellulaceae bacterium]
GTPLPSLGEPKIAAGMVELPFTSQTKLKAAALHYTTDSGPINKRTWKSAPAALGGSSINVAAPPAEGTVWFLTATDERGAIVSTSVRIADGP